MVGPFIFFDRMGPDEVLTGQGVGIRTHPHIGLATVAHLFKGRFHHRDSLGTDRWIEPGAVTPKTAGHGIAGSERVDGEMLEQTCTPAGIPDLERASRGGRGRAAGSCPCREARPADAGGYGPEPGCSCRTTTRITALMSRTGRSPSPARNSAPDG